MLTSTTKIVIKYHFKIHSICICKAHLPSQKIQPLLHQGFPGNCDHLVLERFKIIGWIPDDNAFPSRTQGFQLSLLYKLTVQPQNQEPMCFHPLSPSQEGKRGRKNFGQVAHQVIHTLVPSLVLVCSQCVYDLVKRPLHLWIYRFLFQNKGFRERNRQMRDR